MEDHIKTGFKALDEKIGGLRKGVITVIGSRPAMGLCRFQHNVISNIVEQNQPVLYLSMEDHKAVFIRENGSNRKFAKITEDISPATTGLEAVIFKELNENKFEVVSIDYISSCDKHKFSAVLNELKNIAEKFNLATIFGTDLAEYDWRSAKSDSRPTLDDFTFNKTLLDCMDTVIALHRPSFYYAEDEMEYGKSYGSETELAVLKAANGETGIVEIKFDIDTLKFVN